MCIDCRHKSSEANGQIYIINPPLLYGARVHQLKEDILNKESSI